GERGHEHRDGGGGHDTHDRADVDTIDADAVVDGPLDGDRDDRTPRGGDEGEGDRPCQPGPQFRRQGDAPPDRGECPLGGPPVVSRAGTVGHPGDAHGGSSCSYAVTSAPYAGTCSSRYSWPPRAATPPSSMKTTSSASRMEPRR